MAAMNTLILEKPEQFRFTQTDEPPAPPPAGFALVPLVLAWVWAKTFSPAKPGRDKNAIYECGLESKGDAWVQFRSEYYLYAIIFLIFDVETIFLVPFAVVI